MNTTGKIVKWWFIGSTALAVWINQAPAALILEYKFNETGTSVLSSGTDSTPLTMRNAALTATDLHTAGGGGLSGGPLDRAFDNTASTGMGSGFSGGVANQPDNEAIEPLVAITLQAWYKTSVAPGGYSRLFSSGGGFAGPGIDFIFGAPGANEVGVGINGNPGIYTGSGFSELDQWVFIAMTYTNGSLKIYKGLTGSPVTQVYSATPTFGDIANNGLGFGVGNLYDPGFAQRPFDGLLDNMRLYNSVLSVGDLETLRLLDSSPVPEPSAVLLLITGGYLLWRRRSGS